MHHLNSQSTFSNQVLGPEPVIFPSVFLTKWWPPIHFDSHLCVIKKAAFSFQDSGLEAGRSCMNTTEKHGEGKKVRSHNSYSWSMDYLRAPVLPEHLNLLCPGLSIMLA